MAECTFVEAGTTTRRMRRLRLAFLGVGWIGLNRLQSVVRSRMAQIAAVGDSCATRAAEVAALLPETSVVRTLEELLELDIDGLVIATPSALHAEQAIATLQTGIPVFCQKPLGRTGKETRRVVEAAKTANRLLDVDLSYRWVEGIRRAHDLIRRDEMGEIYAANLVFHNAYGPDKPWFYDPIQAGGGCLMDLGIHLIDLGLWFLGFPEIASVSSRLFARGKPAKRGLGQVEDFALARLDLKSGASLSLTCSWRLPAGRDAIIEASFYGTRGGSECTECQRVLL